MAREARRPTIGLTVDEEGAAFALNKSYVRSVEQAGARPVLLAPGRPDEAAEALSGLDAVLLTGGGDVDPTLYGEPPSPLLKGVSRERDDFEIALALEARRRDLPLLAICRGMQVLNVAMGGSLVQDLASQQPPFRHVHEAERWEPTHEVDLLPQSRIRAILGVERVAVNSFHHQAVRDVGAGLVVSARASGDGVIEALEAPQSRFLLGVQWHPEDFWDHGASFGALFSALTKA